jgi:hypothetical protein
MGGLLDGLGYWGRSSGHRNQKKNQITHPISPAGPQRRGIAVGQSPGSTGPFAIGKTDGELGGVWSIGWGAYWLVG